MPMLSESDTRSKLIDPALYARPPEGSKFQNPGGCIK
jgi:hypothetical protein